MLIDGIDVSPLLKSYTKFEKFRKHLETEQEQAGAIQAFEYTYEQAWKTMKRLLATKGISVQSPRETFREAALNNMIKDPNAWFDFIKVRNITLNTYDEEEIAQVLSVLDPFSKALQDFLKHIGIACDSTI